MTTRQIDSIGKLYGAVYEGTNELVKRAQHINIGELANEPVWYRGHSRAAYTLRPSLFRTANGIECEDRLHQVYRAFKPDLKGWETLFHMQHFFVPTRLLDWTTDLGTALYFAVNDDDCDVPSVYILHPCLLNWEALDRDPSKLLPFCPDERLGGSSGCPYRYPQDYVSQPQPRHRLPIALRPGIKNKRIRAQSSMFTIHGADRRPIEDLCRECLVKIEINVSPGEVKLLRDLGRESRDVFPDETGMSRTLRNRFGLKTIPHSETIIRSSPSDLGRR